MTPTIKLGQLNQHHPLTDKQVYGLRINIARQYFRYVAKEKHPDYYDQWWNGRESGNIDLDLTPSEPLRKDFVTLKKITFQEYTERFYAEIKDNPKAQKALDYLANYNGIVTLLCYCKDENLCHRSLVKEMVLEKQKVKIPKKT